MASSSSAIVASAAAQPRRNGTLALPVPMSTTAALYVTRLVEAKTRFCSFCGNRFCVVFRPKRTCAGCGGTMCGACSTKMEATPGNRPLRVCPGCDARLKACPNFVDHITARQQHGEGVCNAMTTASSQKSASSSPSPAVSSASTSSPPALAFSNMATQTSPCLVIAPSPSFATPPSVLGTNGYAISMAMTPPPRPEPRQSVSPLAWLLRAIGNPGNDNTNGSSSDHHTDNNANNAASNIRSNSNCNVSIRSISTISRISTNSSSQTRSNSESNSGAHQPDVTFASRMDQGEEFLRQKVAGITQGILQKRYWLMGVAAVVVGVSGLAAFVGCSRSRR